jgi:hypothetical protein
METTVKSNVVADVTPCSPNFRYICSRPYGVTSKRVNINHKHSCSCEEGNDNENFIYLKFRHQVINQTLK